MTEYNDELTGVLFPNDKKGNDRAPDVTGKAQIDEIEYRVAGWRRVSQSGKPFFSLKFESKADFEARMAEAARDADPEGALDL